MADEPTAVAESSGIDIEAVSDQIGADLFSDHTAEPSTETGADAPTDSPAIAATEPPPTPTLRPVPSSWKKEYHEHWGKLDPKVQEYWEQREQEHIAGFDKIKPDLQYAKTIRDVLAPYQQILQAKGLDAPRTIDDLLGAYSRLTQGTMEQRQAALQQVAKNFQIQFPGTAADPAAPIDPRVQQLEQQFTQMQQALTAQQQAALETARQKASQEVAAFAADPKNAHFDEVYKELTERLQQGLSLKDAYAKACWDNEVVREKLVQTRLQEETEKAKERARLDALPKKAAKGVNVNGKDTQRPPSDPLGSMEDTMRSTLRSIRERTAH